MMDDTTTLMARLPEPAPPPALAATVMARIAREAARDAVAAPARRRREGLAWLCALAGLAVVFGLSAWGWIGAALPHPMSWSIGPGIPDVLPVEGPAVPLLALGLLLYLAGLFAPLRSGIRR
jgi:hypothetical protein